MTAWRLPIRGSIPVRPSRLVSPYSTRPTSGSLPVQQITAKDAEPFCTYGPLGGHAPILAVSSSKRALMESAPAPLSVVLSANLNRFHKVLVVIRQDTTRTLQKLHPRSRSIRSKGRRSCTVQKDTAEVPARSAASPPPRAGRPGSWPALQRAKIFRKPTP